MSSGCLKYIFSLITKVKWLYDGEEVEGDHFTMHGSDLVIKLAQVSISLLFENCIQIDVQ